MRTKISPFVASHKDWIIRNSIAGYLRAKNMFSNYHRELQAGHLISFADIQKLAELLKSIKDEMHLIFSRMIDPKSRTFEKAKKLIPSEDELYFINNVGLLFHKTILIQELKYVMEHYEEASEEYVETLQSYEQYTERIGDLFRKGTELLRDLLVNHAENVQVLTFFVENGHYVEEAFNESIESLLRRALGNSEVDSAYVRVAKYFIESGWQDRARRWLLEAIRINPNNNEAKGMLERVSTEKK